VGFWNKILEHPATTLSGATRRGQGAGGGLQGEGIKVPILLVHSLWDQEDIYGPVAVYKAIKRSTSTTRSLSGARPWTTGRRLRSRVAGSIRFGSDTGTWFRQNVLRPFLDRYLKDDAPKAMWRR